MSEKLTDQPIFRIETIEGPENSSVSVSPERGGIITSIKLKGKEILFFDQESFNDASQSVRGGIPVLFPNAGPLENSLLKQHGFARNMPWKLERTENGFKQMLIANQSTKEHYPHDFKLVIEGTFENDGFVITQHVQNTGDSEMPIAMGLHPYFPVSVTHKENIEFDFAGGETINAQQSIWEQGGTTSIDNPGQPMVVKIPSLGTLVMEASPEYKKIWVWSLPDRGFICIEPVMRNKGGLVDDPVMLTYGETFEVTLRLKLLTE